MYDCLFVSRMSRDHHATQQDSAVWFNKHPVISTVLWLLGNPEKEDEEMRDSSGKLTWKDADGANLAEFISEVQSKESNMGSPTYARSPTESHRVEKAHLERNNSEDSYSKPSRHGTAYSSLASLNSVDKEEGRIQPRARKLSVDAAADGGTNGEANGDGVAPPTKSPDWEQFVHITPSTQYY